MFNNSSPSSSPPHADLCKQCAQPRTAPLAATHTDMHWLHAHDKVCSAACFRKVELKIRYHKRGDATSWDDGVAEKLSSVEKIDCNPACFQTKEGPA